MILSYFILQKQQVFDNSILSFKLQNNLKLTINLIDQLFVIPLSTDNSQRTTIPTTSNYLDNAGNYASTSSAQEKQSNSNPIQSKAKNECNQKQETISNCNINSRRSPESQQTPVSSPVNDSPTLSYSSPMEDVFLPSSPPQASSSPISFRKGFSKQNVTSPKDAKDTYEKPKNVREVRIKDSNGDDHVALRSPGSSSIQGSVTIRALSEGNEGGAESENILVDNKGNKAGSKEFRCDSNDKSEDFVTISWNKEDSEDDESDSEHQQRKCKKGDPPTEVFKVAALYVT